MKKHAWLDADPWELKLKTNSYSSMMDSLIAVIQIS